MLLKNGAMKNLKFVYLLFLILVVASCAKDQLFDSSDQLPDDASYLKSSSPKLKIAVVSDIHYMSPALLPDDVANNPYFQYYLAKDPKLIALSDPIFREVISELIVEKPDILLIPGDLTKDGELINHEAMSGFLQQLADDGIKVFVVPGNHDINNPEAMTFKGDFPLPVPSVTPEDFESEYENFGYKDALYRDANSLSYINQPFSNLWILGIDACKYDANAGTSDVSGAIKPGTMAWIQEKMAIAREKNITVLAMMHHGIMEHYIGQNSLDPGYVIENYPENVAAFMNAGIRLIFTGHYHANDIVEFSSGGKTLTDVETGSLVTPLSPYRIMILDDNFIKIDTRHVTGIGVALPGGMDFLTYSHLFLSSHLDGYFSFVLQNNYGIATDLAEVVAPFLRNASMAHFAGDEKIGPVERKNLNSLAQVAPSFLVYALNSFWTDLPPNDNNIHIKLK
jgi:predicted MPP superfamily phosphohydrolase